MDQTLFCHNCGAFRELRSIDGVHTQCPQCPAKISIQTLSTSLKGLTKTVEIPRSQLLLRLHGREADANQSEEAEIEEDCPKCKHPRMSFYTAQLRGVDEGQTIFYTCLNERCGHKFTVNS